MGTAVKKFAILLNCEENPASFENINRAIRTLDAEDYSITVASPKPPKFEVAAYFPNEAQNLKSILAGFNEQAEENKQLLVYLTGRQYPADTRISNTSPKTCIPTKTLQAGLANSLYNHRIIIQDEGYLPGSLSSFVDLKTTILTHWSYSRTNPSQNFGKFFWSDQNGGVGNDWSNVLQKRYQSSSQNFSNASQSQFFETYPGSLSGKNQWGPFKDNSVIKVHNVEQLEETLKILEAGQKALVLFGADWCKPCKEYLPNLASLNKKFRGQFLLVYAEGIDGSESKWKQRFGIQMFPQMAMFNHQHQWVVLDNIYDVDHSLIKAGKIYLSEIRNPKPQIRRGVILALTQSPKQVQENWDSIWAGMTDSERDIRKMTTELVAQHCRKSSELLETLKKKFFNKIGKDWFHAGLVLKGIAEDDELMTKKLIEASEPLLDGFYFPSWKVALNIWVGLKNSLGDLEKKKLFHILNKNLDSSDPARRFQAGWAGSFFRFEEEKVFSRLLEALKGQNSEHFEMALERIQIKFPKKIPEILPEIRTALNHPDRKIRSLTLRFVEKNNLSIDLFLNEILYMLGDSDPEIQINATYLLFQRGILNIDFEGQFKQHLQSEDPWVAHLAYEKLFTWYFEKVLSGRGGPHPPPNYLSKHPNIGEFSPQG